MTRVEPVEGYEREEEARDEGDAADDEEVHVALGGQLNQVLETFSAGCRGVTGLAVRVDLLRVSPSFPHFSGRLCCWSWDEG